MKFVTACLYVHCKRSILHSCCLLWAILKPCSIFGVTPWQRLLWRLSFQGVWSPWCFLPAPPPPPLPLCLTAAAATINSANLLHPRPLAVYHLRDLYAIRGILRICYIITLSSPRYFSLIVSSTRQAVSTTPPPPPLMQNTRYALFHVRTHNGMLVYMVPSFRSYFRGRRRR